MIVFNRASKRRKKGEYRYFLIQLKKAVLWGHSKKTETNRFSRPIITYCKSKVLQNAPVEHSAVLLTCIKLPHGFKTFDLSIFEWRLTTGFTVVQSLMTPSISSFLASGDFCHLPITFADSLTLVVFLKEFCLQL